MFLYLRRYNHLAICLLTGISFDSIASAGVGEIFEHVYRVRFSSLPVFGVNYLFYRFVGAVSTDYALRTNVYHDGKSTPVKQATDELDSVLSRRPPDAQ
jgi:hypothetical protein